MGQDPPATMRAELIAIATETAPLDGIYYEPLSRAPRGAVQLMHGNCMNFYVGAPRFLPPALTSLGYACLAYNRRGHDVLGTRDSRVLEGGAFQTVAEAKADNVHAAEWLAARGFARPVVIGHSHGGVLAAAHVAARGDAPALVLLSAHRGGAEIAARISAHELWARDDYERVLRAARACRDPRELLLLPGWWHVIGAASALDFAANVPDLLELAPRIRCPVLYLHGDRGARGHLPGTRVRIPLWRALRGRASRRVRSLLQRPGA